MSTPPVASGNGQRNKIVIAIGTILVVIVFAFLTFGDHGMTFDNIFPDSVNISRVIAPVAGVQPSPTKNIVADPDIEAPPPTDPIKIRPPPQENPPPPEEVIYQS